MTRRNFIYLFLAMAASVVTCACTDDSLIDTDPYRKPGNTIAFEVSSGQPSGENADASRSAATADDEDDGLAPVVYAAGSDTLYLHRYVAPESERATGRGATVSRSTPVNTVTDFASVCKDGGFKVKATFTADETEYFPLSKAVELAGEAGGDVWHLTNPSRYWPDDRELRFQAIAPGSAWDLLQNTTMTADGVTFDYTVPVSTDSPRRDAECQPDIMVATTVCSHTDGTIDCDKAPLNFRHALAAIKFAVRDVTTGEIADISIKGVAGSGSCLFTSESGFTWSDLGETADYTQVFNYKTTDVYPAEAPVTPIDMPEKTFMLIPQEIPDDAVLEITLVSGGRNKTLSGKLKTADIPLWEPGKEYVYTISTSSENWTYVFDVIGSDQAENEDNPAEGTFSDAIGKIEINHTVTTGSYYKVLSYRYRTNKPSIIEPVEWSATSTDGKNVVPDDLNEYASKIPEMNLAPDVWFPEKTFEGAGGTDYKKYDLTFATQYVATDYAGDWVLRTNAENGSENAPVDLSMVDGVRNTANCYVVNAGGWYKIPLYYGNSITGGETNEKSYKKLDYVVTEKMHNQALTFNPLAVFQDYKGNAITSPEIKGANDATLVWEDAYGIIDDVKLNSSKDYLIFHIDKTNLQQSNGVVAIIDSDSTIMWSWHIWVSDYWADSDLKLTNGVINCDAWDKDRGTFDLAPRNLGWCDPKNVWYLRRQGDISFAQKHSGKQENLHVVQRNYMIEYWEGNNAYYQFGRKDPMVGFINDTNKVKYNFGPMQYSLSPQPKEIKDGITSPNVLFAGAPPTPDGAGADASLHNDWVSTAYYNLWNNYSEGRCLTDDNKAIAADYAYSAVKTIYDPSPAGFVVPPLDYFKLFTKGRTDANATAKLSNFNGTYEFLRNVIDVLANQERSFYQFNAYPRRDGTGEACIILTGTGHRWYSTSAWGSGNNSNPHIVYLWANTGTFGKDRGAYSLAIGDDSRSSADAHFCITSRFSGRRAIARPIRCVREK